MSRCHAVLRGLGLPQYMLFREEKHAGVNAVHDGGQTGWTVGVAVGT